MWLTSYDPNGVWTPVEVRLERAVQIGSRSDHVWSHLEHSIRLQGGQVQRVILGTRHAGFDIWHSTTWPIQAYLCTLPLESAERIDFSPDEVTIAAWGLLHESINALRPTSSKGTWLFYESARLRAQSSFAVLFGCVLQLGLASCCYLRAAALKVGKR
jgi:hypothetical protein